jgi:hypothetical protein
MPHCPFVFPAGRADGPRTALFENLKTPAQVATNNPSFLDGNLEQTAAYLQIRLFSGGARLAVAAIPAVRRGERALVIADHSIFINEMMLQPDIENWAFALNVVRWLADTGGGDRRTEVLFYEDGRIQSDFNVSLDMPVTPPIPLEALVPLADETVAQLEQENAFNNMILEAVGGPNRMMELIAGLLTFTFLLFGLYRFLQARIQPNSGATAPWTDAIDRPPTSAIERRHEFVLAQGNLAEAARELAHQAFAAVGLAPSHGALSPTVTVSGPWWARTSGHRWRRLVQDLWALATRGPARRISPAALRALDRTVHDLLAAVAAGKVRLAAAESPI